jgi:hypothetical protein
MHCCTLEYICTAFGPQRYRMCPPPVPQDDSLLGTALDFYRLSSAFLLRLASPAAAAGGPPSLPLPEPPAPAFCMLPVSG